MIRGVGLIQTTEKWVVDGWRRKGVLVHIQPLLDSIRYRLDLLRIYH